MDISKLNNKIVIIKDGFKNTLLDLINKESKLFNIKIITLNELKKNYCFDYNNEAVYYVSSKYNVIGDIAKIYLENLYYIKDVEDNKVKFLKSIKEDLDNNNLIIYNSEFKEFLKNKDIVLIDLDYIDSFYTNIINDISSFANVSKLEIKSFDDKKCLYEAKTKDEEIEFVASKICELIKSGVNINNIKISNVNSDYYYLIKKTFKLFNIPINLKSISNINGTIIVKKFKELYSSNINSTMDELYEYVKSSNDNEIYKKLIDIINSYSFIDDYEKVRSLVYSDINNDKTINNNLKNAVNVVDLENDIISEDNYVFLINFNEGIIPINYKDEDYLSDKVKSLLGVSESSDLNNKANLNIKSAIRRTKNIIVSYSKYNSNSEVFISPSYDEDLFEFNDLKIDYNNSNSFNKLKLVSELDNYYKYGSVSDRLILLNNNYDEEYKNYSNKYSLINTDELYEYLQNRLSLSYSSLNTYNECAFKYYIDYVIKVNKYEDSFEIIVGNIFHKILSECFCDDYDFDKRWNEIISETKYDFKYKDKFFLNLLRDELILVIETIKNQLNYTQLSKTMYEKEIIVKINDELNITFKGFVDKIMYDEIDGNTIVVIVDYKTGNPNININNSYYGLDMQLPIYMYLVKNEIKNVKIGGFYLQKIISNDKNKENRINNLKLQGYSNSDTSILSKVDSSYMDSKIIKSLKVGSNGFYSYSKIINDNEIDILYDIVDKKIKETSQNILNANFDINPKKINDINKGCKYCRYSDICYRRNEDIVELKEVKDIFGGEDNA